MTEEVCDRLQDFFDVFLFIGMRIRVGKQGSPSGPTEKLNLLLLSLYVSSQALDVLLDLLIGARCCHSYRASLPYSLTDLTQVLRLACGIPRQTRLWFMIHLVDHFRVNHACHYHLSR